MTIDRTTLDPFIVDSSPDGIVVVDRTGIVVFANPAAELLLGYAGATAGMHVSRFIPDAFRARHAHHREDYHESPSPRPMGLGRELSALRADGTLVPVEISLSPLGDTSGFVVAVLRDVSVRRQLRSLGAATLAAAERERGRIARELHDDVLQRLAAMLLSIKLITNREGNPDTEALYALRDQLDDAADRLRRLARGLRPSELEEVGVELALRRLVREFGEAGGPPVEFECGVPDDHVPEPVALALFRIVQESLWNAQRHAGATKIRVWATCDGNTAHVLIEDDGSGFDVAAERRSDRGLGLRGMFERAAAVGGRLHIQSAPDEGTRVTAELPYHMIDVEGGAK